MKDSVPSTPEVPRSETGWMVKMLLFEYFTLSQTQAEVDAWLYMDSFLNPSKIVP